MNTLHGRSAFSWVGPAILSLAAVVLLVVGAVKGAWSWVMLGLACAVGVASILVRSGRGSRVDGSQIRVTMQGDELLIEGPDGVLGRIAWAKLERVYIETPGVASPAEEITWVLMTAEGQYAIHAGAVGAADLLGRLRQLPEFDNPAVLRAMRAATTESFLCWQRRK